MFSSRPSRVCAIVLLVLSSLVISATSAAAATKGKPKELKLLIGTYTAKQSRGIYRCRFNTKSGQASEPELIAKVDNPSFMALSEDGKILYAVSEGGGNHNSALNAYIYDNAAEELKIINRQPTLGASPCYVALANGKAITANYTGGSFSVMPINADGSLGKATPHPIEHQGRRSHVHGIFPSPDGKSIYVTDLGCDLLLKIDSEGNIISRTS